MIGNTLLLTQSKPSSIVNLDMAGHRIAVDRLLIKASGLVRRNVHAEYNIDTGRQKIFPHRAVLIAANLTKYDLRGVDLRGACLIAADLRQSELVGTDFIGADFRDADVRGADLSRSLFLTQNQINSAKGDASTRLPSYLIRPEHWGKEFGEVINMGEESKRTVTVEDYIVASPEAIQPRLREIRRIIIDAAPQLKEKISWQMPTFYSERNIIHFAAHKNHIGLYPGPKAIEFFEDRLTGYKTSKGAIQLPHQKELDPDLIRDLVRYNLEGYR